VSAIDDRAIHNAIESSGYFQQGALIGESFKRLLNMDLETFSLIFVESDRPHCVRIESLADKDYDLGWEANRTALRAIRRGLDTNYWPGPKNRDGQGNTFNLSTSARERIERRIERLSQDLAA
jgi:hypothetical protein